ncbi:hypothetical protein DFH07DRAFT_816037 [Mycena maculata]|uniref:Uncharacterized protein n=1 Tax=Mycena maculata TaxID=230809 RepID=A0AAD7JC95_9AGAR|nr:hypothetical protein DFH07DRAFT_816037 [Mycena maculata]
MLEEHDPFMGILLVCSPPMALFSSPPPSALARPHHFMTRGSRAEPRSRDPIRLCEPPTTRRAFISMKPSYLLSVSGTDYISSTDIHSSMPVTSDL